MTGLCASERAFSESPSKTTENPEQAGESAASSSSSANQPVTSDNPTVPAGESNNTPAPAKEEQQNTPEQQPVVPGHPLTSTVQQTTETPPSQPVEELPSTPSSAPEGQSPGTPPSPTPSQPTVSPDNPQPQDTPQPQLPEKAPLSPQIEDLQDASQDPPEEPSNLPDYSVQRYPQSVSTKEEAQEEEAQEIFDYSPETIIFYKPCDKQSSLCKYPMMTNMKNIMFKHDLNRNINVNGIATEKKATTTNPPVPDISKDESVN